ncbi:MAG: cyclodeaminase/cyclohydrolase family protein [Bacilli bacterium]|nr:cyclodeaminase/cyclohydrolase family protein [Bacilli bacterium]
MRRSNVLVELKVKEFINEVDSSKPAPGGGSVSALAATLGVALAKMVAHLTFNKKKFLELDDMIRHDYLENFTILTNIKDELVKLIDEDTEAFNEFMKALELPKNTEEEIMIRKQALKQATLKAIEVPNKVMHYTVKALETTVKMMPFGSKNAISDIGVGALLLYSGLEGATLNVLINLKGLDDESLIDQYQKTCEINLAKGKLLKHQILDFVYQGLK